MDGFCSENSKLKVFLIAKDEKLISLRMSLTKALYTVHTSQLKPAQLVWYDVVWILRIKSLVWLDPEKASLQIQGPNSGLFIGCLTSQQHASVSLGRICSDNFTCCHTEIEVADPAFYLTQSQYTDTRLTSPSADPITPGAWQGSHWSANFWVTGTTRPWKKSQRKRDSNPGFSALEADAFPLGQRGGPELGSSPGRCLTARCKQMDTLTPELFSLPKWKPEVLSRFSTAGTQASTLLLWHGGGYWLVV